MLHGRTDYQHIQDTTGKIGPDEPVMLFRAKDALAPEALMAYADLVRRRMDDADLVTAIERQSQRMRDWQAVHGKEFPDVLPHHVREGGLTDEELAVAESFSARVQEAGGASAAAMSGESMPLAETLTPAADDSCVGAPGAIPPVHGENPYKKYADPLNPHRDRTTVVEGADQSSPPTDDLETVVHTAGQAPDDPAVVPDTPESESTEDARKTEDGDPELQGGWPPPAPHSA